MTTPDSSASAYAAAGVDIDAGNRAKTLMQAAVRSTRRPEVLADFGSFGGLFALKPLNLRDPVLVTSIDGVGTKLKVAFTLGRHDTVGGDIVAHCVNDILVCGARPLMFLDYLGLGEMTPDVAATIVAGVAVGCREAGCALIGGETAQMPGFYAAGEYDLAGCIIGIVERDAIVTGAEMQAGDVVIGLPSIGLHTNGYSLARQVFADMDWTTPVPELGRSIGDELLQPHRSYLAPLRRVLDDPALASAVTGMAHITGGGLLENIPRVVPAGLGVDLDATRWEILPVFRLMQARGNVSWAEMCRVFNIGIGYVVMARATQADAVLAALGEDAGARVIGRVVERTVGEGVRVEGLPQ
jgi:phosphoribosylformylglycinamidine cyclo-ligase